MTSEPGSIRRVLEHALDDAQAQISALTRDLHGVIDASRSSNADDEHDPEGATIAFDRAQVAALLSAARQRRADLSAALERLDAGTYGVCAGCDRPIPAQRLAVRPAARTCVSCAERRRPR